MRKGIIILLSVFLFSCDQKNKTDSLKNEKPTICILGGTPSTKEVLDFVPDSLKIKYEFISFNRPGYGGTNNSRLSKEKIIDLVRNAGLTDNDFGIIGISGGAPLAILIASELNLKHCGVICGMVTNEAYFKHADSTITKNIMETATKSYQDFNEAVSAFPNVEQIVKQAGAKNKEIAIRACYDEINYILSNVLSESITNKSISIDWFHGENDKNVSLESTKEFLKDFKNSGLRIIPDANHNVDSKRYIKEIVENWN